MVERVVKEEEKAHLWKAVDALSDVYRIPLLLYYMENQNVASIVKLLSIPQGTVKSLNASIVKKAKETQNMKHRTLKSGVAAAAAIGILVVGSASAYAAYRYLTPSQVADQMTEDGALAKAFESKDAITINETQKSASYEITLMGIVTGKDLSVVVNDENRSVISTKNLCCHSNYKRGWNLYLSGLSSCKGTVEIKNSCQYILNTIKYNRTSKI